MKSIRHRRAGLALYRQIAGDPADAGTLDAVLQHASPAGRLATIRARAAHYPGDETLSDEVEWVAERLGRQNGNAEWADLHALTALERGLDLLETGRFLDSIVRDFKRQKAASRGGIESGKARTKLPDAATLERQIVAAIACGNSKREASRMIAMRHGVTTQAVWQARKKGRETK